MLLTKKEKRAIDILVLLQNHGVGKRLSVSEVVQMSHLKKAQFLTFLEQLQFDLKKAEIPLQLLIHSETIELLAEQPTKNYVFLLQSYYKRNSGVFRMAEELFLGKIESIDIFAEKYFYSRSVAYQYRSSLIELLSNFNLSFEIGSTKPIRGKERQIRLFYSYIFSLAGPYFSLETKKLPSEKFFSEIKKKLAQLNYGGNLMFIELMIKISIIRNNTDAFLSAKDIEEYKNIDSFPFSFEKFSADFLELFKEYWMHSMHSSSQNQKYEKKFWYIFLCIINSYPYDTIQSLSFTSAFLNNDSKYKQLTDFWITQFSHFFSYQLTPNEYAYLYSNLFSVHVLSSLGKIPTQLFLNYDNLRAISNDYPLVFYSLKDFYKVLCKEENGKFFKTHEELIYVYGLYFLGLIKSKNTAIHVMLAMDNGSIQTSYFQRLIRHNTYINIEFVDQNEPKIDLAITSSTSPNKTEDADYLIYVNESPTKNDLYHIRKTLSEIYQKKVQTIDLSLLGK